MTTWSGLLDAPLRIPLPLVPSQFSAGSPDLRPAAGDKALVLLNRLLVDRDGLAPAFDQIFELG